MRVNFEILSGGGYRLCEGFFYESKRYGKKIYCPANMYSDGATFAIDIASAAWWVHDRLCYDGSFFDGSPCTVAQASMVLYDILREEGRWFRAPIWAFFTWAFGGGECKANGWI